MLPENKRDIDPEYSGATLTLKPSNRLHTLVAMLFDTDYDVLTDERIHELETHVAQFRWMNASGKRLDKL